MWTLLILAALTAITHGRRDSCSFTNYPYIQPYFSVTDGLWVIALGWKEENIDCTVHLKGEVDSNKPFETIDTEWCKSATFCYFNTTRQVCEDGQPKYTSMKFESDCSCKVSSFTFKISNYFNVHEKDQCGKVFVNGKKVKTDDFEFKECYKRRCGGVEEDLGPGCYCKNGLILDPQTGSCVSRSLFCGLDPLPLNLNVEGCYTTSQTLQFRWEVDSARNYTYIIFDLSGNVLNSESFMGETNENKGFKVSGKIGTLNIAEGTLIPGSYKIKVVDHGPEPDYSEEKDFSIKTGCKDIQNLSLDINPFCDSEDVQRTDITWDVAGDRSYSYEISDSSGRVIGSGQGSGSGGKDFSVSNGKALVSTSLNTGEYEVTIKDLTAGDKEAYNEKETFTVEKCNVPLDLVVPNCVKSTESSFDISWNVRVNRMYRYQIHSGDANFTDTVSGGQSSGDFVVKDGRGTLTVRSPGQWTVGLYKVTVIDMSVHGPSMGTASFEVRKGCNTIQKLSIDVKSNCNPNGIQRSEITWDVAGDRSYSYEILDSSDKGISSGEGSGLGDGDFSVSNGKALVSTSLTPGDYKVTVKDLTAGDKEFYSETKYFTIAKCPISIELVVPDCVKSTQSSIEISWSVRADRIYKYKVRGGDVLLTDTVSGGQSSGDFIVKDGRGTLTVRSSGEWTVAIYRVTITDISVHGPSMNSSSFKVRKGCQPEMDLEINARGFCVDEMMIPTAIMSWRVENDRAYKYTVSKSGQIVDADTVPGSGNSNFSVVNGRGQIELRVDPGNYTVTVQDLEAGVKEYHTESMDFSVPDCKFPISIASCVHTGEKATVSFVATLEFTYEFAVVAEDNPNQLVLAGSIGGPGQHGQNMNYMLEKSDSLPVGRYVLAVREKETNASGYGRFLVSDRGDVGPDVKYTADPQDNDLYICLDPFEGKYFVSELKVKIGTAEEKSLVVGGQCFRHEYSNRSPLTIAVRKEGEDTHFVDIQFVG